MTDDLNVEIQDEPEIVTQGDVLTMRFTGFGLFKIFIAQPVSKENVFQKGFAIVYENFAPTFQKTFIKTAQKFVIKLPELIFCLKKINEAGKIQNRTLVLTQTGLKNFRENGNCSSITPWRHIYSAIDKGNTVHIIQRDGKRRVYQTPLYEFLCLCLNKYYTRVMSSESRSSPPENHSLQRTLCTSPPASAILKSTIKAYH